MAEALNQYKSSLTPEEVDQALHNIAQLDDGIAQAKQYAEQAQGYAESINPGNFYTKDQADSAFAPYIHRSSSPIYGNGTETYFGHVKLTDTPGDFAVANGTAATPKCVQDAIAPQQITPTFQGGFSDAGATRIYKCGNVVVCTFQIEIGDHAAGWNDVCIIPAYPIATVYGRTLVSGHSSDFAVRSSDGLFRVYLQSSDSGNIYLPVCYVTG